MTTTELKSVMKYHLKNFNDEKLPIGDSTIHKDILSDSDGPGNRTSMKIFKMAIRYTIHKANHPDKNWPSNWMDMDVAALAAKLI